MKARRESSSTSTTHWLPVGHQCNSNTHARITIHAVQPARTIARWRRWTMWCDAKNKSNFGNNALPPWECITDTKIKGIEHWMSQCHQPFQIWFPFQDRSSCLTQLESLEQNDIGWNNFMKGGISKCWGQAQQIHCTKKAKQCATKKEKESEKKHNSEFFARNVQCVWEMWKARNDDHHNMATANNTPQSMTVHKKVAEPCQEAEPLTIDNQRQKQTVQKGHDGWWRFQENNQKSWNSGCCAP